MCRRCCSLITLTGTWGATILIDVKNGSDKRDDSTIRLTLLRSPGGASEMKGATQTN